MHGLFGNGELLALSFLAFLQAGLWAKLLLLKHQDRDLLLLQRYIRNQANTCTIVQLHIYAVVRLSVCVSMSASLHVVNMFFL